MPGVGVHREERRVETLAHTPRLVLEHSDIKDNGLAAPPIAGRVMLERRRIALPLLERAPEREVQVGLVRIVAAIALHQSLHGRDLGIVELVGFQVGEAPIYLAEIWIEPEAGLVGFLAFAAMAQSLVQVTDRKAQAHFVGIEARRLLESYQRVRLA